MKCGLSSLVPHAHAKNEVVMSVHGESQRKMCNSNAMAEM